MVFEMTTCSVCNCGAVGAQAFGRTDCPKIRAYASVGMTQLKMRLGGPQIQADSPDLLITQYADYGDDYYE